MKCYGNLIWIGLVLILVAVGCEKMTSPLTDVSVSDGTESDQLDALVEVPPEIKAAMRDIRPLTAASYAAPGPLVTVAMADETLEFWPYTGANFEGIPQDPINLIFYGEADPRDIRAALIGLDGDRSGTPFPPVPPFTLTWKDCIGDVQTGYASESGWTGGVIQVALGDYESPRFHMRLFKVGNWTVANAHFEVLIPGTADHQVLSWELAEQLVIADIMRTGLLDPVTPMVPVGTINDAPFHTIPAVIYNGLPVELRQLIGGPLGDVTEDVDIMTDGQALILNLASKTVCVQDRQDLDFVIHYNQTIPKPFCSSGPYDYVHVTGPVNMRQISIMTPAGNYMFGFVARGNLEVLPVNPMTGEPMGEPLSALVLEHHAGRLSSNGFRNSSLTFQKLLPSDADGAGWLFKHLRVNSSGANGYREIEDCVSDGSAKRAVSTDGSITSFLRPGAVLDTH